MTYISGGTLEGVLRLQTPASTPALSVAGEGRIYFDGTQFQASQNGAAYAAVVGGGGGGGWTDDGTVVRLTTATDQVGIGTPTPAANTKFEVAGDATNRNINLIGGSGATVGGSINLTAGVGGTTGTGGQVSVTGGPGGSTSGDAGGVLVTGGTPIDGNGGQTQIRGSNGVGTNRSAGGILLYSGDATGSGNAGILQLEVGTTLTGDPGGVFVITPANSPFDVNVGGNVRFETLNGGTTDFVLDGGTLTVGSTNLVVQDNGNISLTGGNNSTISLTAPASTGQITATASAINLNGIVHNLNAQNPQLTTPDNTAAYVLRPAGSYWTSSGSLIAMPALYYDPQSGQTVTRFGNSVVIDGDGVNNTVCGLDATAQVRQALLENVPGATQDLADYTLTGTPLVPGTVTIRVILSGQSTFSTVTDDGAGNFPVSSVLASGGTVDYSTGAMTGVTQLLQAGGDLAAYYVTDDVAGENLTPRGGDGQGTGAGGEVTLRGGNGGANGTGGNVFIFGGEQGDVSGSAGNVIIRGGFNSTAGDSDGGTVAITGSNGRGTDRYGGQVVITTGSATGSGNAGGFAVVGGTGGVTGNGASLTMTGGPGGTTSGNGGSIELTGGTPVNGAGGSVFIYGASAAGTNQDGGFVTLHAGTRTGTGVFGYISFVTDGPNAFERMRVQGGTGNVGVATIAPASRFDVNASVGLGSIQTISGNDTLDALDAVVLVNAAGGPITVTLPAVSGISRRRYTIKKIDASANAVTIDANGAETIDGVATQTLPAQYDTMEIVTNGTEWFIV